MNLIEFDIPAIIATVKKLNADTKPNWGQMRVKKMLRHLVDIARVSNGKQQVDFANKPEHLPKLQHILHKEAPFPIGFAAPPQIEALIVAANGGESVNTLIEQLGEELRCFETHFSDAEQKETNAVFGPLNKEDWILFHRKHISHHLCQFGLWSYE